MRRKPVVRRPGLALALRRHPRWRTAAAIALGVAGGLAAMSAVQGAERARSAWGRSAEVLVAVDDLDAGAAVGAGDVRREELPLALVPDDAVTELGADARTSTPVLEGEVLRDGRLADPGASAVAARVPPGMRAMAVPVDPGTTPSVEVGDRVEVLVTLPPEAAGSGPPGFALATGCPVVDVTDTAVTIAVEAHVAPRLAAAFGMGAVTLALVP